MVIYHAQNKMNPIIKGKLIQFDYCHIDILLLNQFYLIIYYGNLSFDPLLFLYNYIDIIMITLITQWKQSDLQMTFL